jgi:hypothetical protein
VIQSAIEEQRGRYAEDVWQEKVIQYAEEESALPVGTPRGSVSVSEVRRTLLGGLKGHATEAENGYNVYYFSPAAAKLAAGLISRYSGVPCEAPQPSEVVALFDYADLANMTEQS